MANYDFDGLSEAQMRALSCIAFGGSQAHPRRTMARLEKKGLIVKSEVREGNLTVFVYDMPLPVHMAFCQWCYDNCPEEID